MSYQPPHRTGRGRIFVINLFHELMLGHELVVAGATGASAVWPAANRLLAIPFTLQERATATKAWYATGSTQTGNLDMGILDEVGNRQIRNGGVALGTTSAVHTVDFTDTPLDPGRYFLAISSDSGSATFQSFAPNLNFLAGIGVKQMATAYPIPDPVTFADPTSAYLPFVGLQFRAEDVA